MIKELGKTGMRYNQPGPGKCKNDTSNFMLASCNHTCSVRVRALPPISRRQVHEAEQAWREGQNSEFPLISTPAGDSAPYRCSAVHPELRKLPCCGVQMLCVLSCVMLAPIIDSSVCASEMYSSSHAGVSAARHPPRLFLFPSGRSPARGQ